MGKMTICFTLYYQKYNSFLKKEGSKEKQVANFAFELIDIIF